MALNVSAKDLRDDSVIEYLLEAVNSSGIEADMIEIELTESSILENEESTLALLKKLRERGIKIALDDFGTGYNSLIDFIKIPFDHLKIDKIFIDGMTDDVNQMLIETVIRFAHQIGKIVIAEGVEKKEQFDALKEMHCDYMQGYYFSRPLPPEEINSLLCSGKTPKTGTAQIHAPAFSQYV